MSPRTGRPPKDNPKSESIHIRVTPEEKKEIVDFSKKSGNTILEMIRAGMAALKKK